METSRKYRFLVWLCLRLRLSIALKSGLSISTFKLSNDAMAPELSAGDIVAVDTGATDRPLRTGEIAVASIKCASWDTATTDAADATSDAASEDMDSELDSQEREDSSSEEERRLVVRKVAAIAGDPIPVRDSGSASRSNTDQDATVPEGCVYLLANDPSQGPDSSFADVGPRPVSDILGRIVAVRKRGRIIWLD